MAECALCLHDASEHTPRFLKPAMPCQVRFISEVVQDGEIVRRDEDACGCPGFEPLNDESDSDA